MSETESSYDAQRATAAGASQAALGPGAIEGPRDAREAQGSAARRRGGNVQSMVISLAVVLGIVVVVISLIPKPSGQGVRVQDYRPFVTQAVLETDYPVMVPEGLGADWRSRSARVEQAPGEGSAWWSVAFTTPSGADASFSQVDGSGSDRARFVQDWTSEGAGTGTVELDGETWERRVRDNGDTQRRSLVLEQQDSVVVVVGEAPWGELEELAASLEPRERGAV